MAKSIKSPVVSEWQKVENSASGASYLEYVWAPGSTTKKSVDLIAPTDAALFTVTAPTSVSNFSVTCRIDQLSELDAITAATRYSTYTGSAKTNDKLKISDAGVIGDALFTNISSVEVLMLQGAGNYDVTLAAQAEEAGFVDVVGGLFNDRLDASAYSKAIELDGNAGDDTLIGGLGADTLIGGLGADVIALEAGGNDVVVFSSVLDGSAPGSAGGEFSGFDTVTGFEAGMDQVEVRFTTADPLTLEILPTQLTLEDGTPMVDGSGALVMSDPLSLTSVDAVVGAMNAAIPAGATYGEGEVVLFTISNGLAQGLYAGTVSDADLTDDAFTPAFMASGVACLGMFTPPAAV